VGPVCLSICGCISLFRGPFQLDNSSRHTSQWTGVMMMILL
jgi:hypothetical protein